MQHATPNLVPTIVPAASPSKKALTAAEQMRPLLPKAKKRLKKLLDSSDDRVSLQASLVVVDHQARAANLAAVKELRNTKAGTLHRPSHA